MQIVDKWRHVIPSLWHEWHFPYMCSQLLQALSIDCGWCEFGRGVVTMATPIVQSAWHWWQWTELSKRMQRYHGFLLHSSCMCYLCAHHRRSIEKGKWFSLSFEVITIHGMFYLNVCVWCFFDYKMYSFHLMTISLFDHYTSLIMFEPLANFRHAVFSKRSSFLVAVLNDGDWSIIESIQDFLTELLSDSNLELFGFWCCLH